jgi:hypothetical protein
LFRTDHSGLRFLQQIYENKSRLIRWSVKLAGFEILVEFRPGTNIPHVDVLSIHVHEITADRVLNKVVKEQKTEEFLSRCGPENWISGPNAFRTQTELYIGGRNTGNLSY